MFDQELAKMRDSLPRAWWALYQGSLAAGFSEGQSMVLLQTWILSMNTSGIRPPSTDGPPKEED